MGAVNFYRHVVEHTGMSLEAAKRATPAVLQALRDRLTPQEARQLAAQLPRPIRVAWNVGDVAGRRPAKIRRPAFYARVRSLARFLRREPIPEGLEHRRGGALRRLERHTRVLDDVPIEVYCTHVGLPPT